MGDFGAGFTMLKEMMRDHRTYQSFYFVMQSEMARMATYKPET